MSYWIVRDGLEVQWCGNADRIGVLRHAVDALDDVILFVDVVTINTITAPSGPSRPLLGFLLVRSWFPLDGAAAFGIAGGRSLCVVHRCRSRTAAGGGDVDF